MLVRLVSQGPFALAEWRNVLFQSWFCAPTMDGVRASCTASERLLARAGKGKAVAICVIGGKLELPDDATRKFSAEMMRKVDGQLLGSATVLEGEGFALSAARAAMAGLTLLARAATPQKVFQTTDEATA